MNSVLEYADLVEEQEIHEKTVQCNIDIKNESCESKSESLDQDIDTNISIEKIPHKENLYRYSFHINRSYCKFIVGFKGTMLKKLCSETNTKIRVLKQKKYVVIDGSVKKRIIHAKQEIDKLIENSKSKLRFTHFISIPTNANDMTENFIKFKNNVLINNDSAITGFNKDMFQKPEKLHLTICMLHLLEDSDQQKAIEALNDCKKDIIDPILKKSGPLSIEFKGLKCMQNNLTRARILYIDVHEETGFLQEMSNTMNDYFIKQGLSKKNHDNVALHMTVINTYYLKQRKKKNKKNIKYFDATNILKDHKNTYLGKMNLSMFHLSKLTSKSVDGYFEATAKIQF